MLTKFCRVGGLAALLAVPALLLTAGGGRADDPKATDGGRASEFQSKSFDLKDGDQTSITLTCEAGKEVTVTTRGDKESDVHLMMKSKYYQWKDTSPTPVCLLKFTPVQGDDKFTFTLKNQGGANKVTLAVKVATGEAKPADLVTGSGVKSQSFDMKDGDEKSVPLTFEAGREVTVTTKGEGDSDTHLLVKSKYFEWKDTSPSPVCLFKFTPVKGDDNFTFTLRNMRAANKITLAVKVSE